MSVEQLVKGAIEIQMQNLAERIEGDLKSAVAPHSRSGMALGAIHIEKRDVDNYFIGGTDGTGKGITGTDHLAMLDEGNGGSGSRIYPTTAKALYLKDYGIWRGSVRGYNGIHFVAKVANKYR